MEARKAQPWEQLSATYLTSTNRKCLKLSYRDLQKTTLSVSFRKVRRDLNVGGSHDRSEMLPLKAGFAIMALETLATFPGTKLRIIPTGLHYFNGDKFRSRAVVEYGEAIEVPVELVDQYRKGGMEKRKAISLLLDTVYVRLKALTLQAPDFESLMVAQASRRLYQTDKIDADTALIISRRFANVDELLI